MTPAPAGGAPPKAPYLAAIAAAAAVGTLLRLWMLPGQILLDDEWHGLNRVAGASFGEVLTRFDAKTNTSLPLNLYHWLLLHTTGWSELGVRLPAIAAGVAALFLLPIASRKFVGDRASIFFAFLLAVSPFAIFYSRFSRSYAPMLLLGFLALLAACRWPGTGDQRAKKVFLWCGISAAYFHPLAAVVLMVPFGMFGWGKWRGGKGGATVEGISVAAISAGEVRKTALLVTAWLAPLAWGMLSASERLPWGQGSWSGEGLRDTATLLAGTTNIPMALVVLALFAWGVIALRRSSPPIVGALAMTAAGYLIVLAVTRPLGLDNGVVIVRYAIVLLPLVLLAVAAGADDLARRAGVSGGSFSTAMFIAFVSALFFLGPLPGAYASPNNFTNHSAWQGRYDPPDPRRAEARHVYPGYPMTIGEVPGYYHSLAARPGGAIVEYPFDIANYNNLDWYYQRVHGREVIAGYRADRAALGYRTEARATELEAAPRLGLISADQILSRVDDTAALRFRNMVDVGDPAAMERTGAEAIVLHKSIMAVRFFPGGRTDFARVYYSALPAFTGALSLRYGPPVYEDSTIVCFQLKKP